MLEQITHPYIAAELQLLRSQGKRIRYDGDLTGIPVSITSRSYPNAAYGQMDDEIRLGFQAALVSLLTGPPPRVWGKLDVQVRYDDDVRSTPTRVGKTPPKQ